MAHCRGVRGCPPTRPTCVWRISSSNRGSTAAKGSSLKHCPRRDQRLQIPDLEPDLRDFVKQVNLLFIIFNYQILLIYQRSCSMLWCFFPVPLSLKLMDAANHNTTKICRENITKQDFRTVPARYSKSQRCCDELSGLLYMIYKLKSLW